MIIRHADTKKEANEGRWAGMVIQATSSEEVIARHGVVAAPAIYKYTSVVIARGEGVYVFDPEARRYLDFAAGIATNNVGHCHPEVVEAIREQAGRLIHAASHVAYYEPYVALAEKVRSIAPGSLREGKVILVNSGSEAVEAAVKLARYITGRSTVIAFLGSFHGRPMGALALTASNAAYRRHLDGLMAGVHHAPYPYTSRCPFGHRDPEECAQSSFTYIHLLLRTVVPPEDLAAIIVEPILGEGGYVVPPPSFLPGLRRICDEVGALLIADEVQTGLGRTGRWYAVEHWGVVPDLTTFAKPLGGGLPLGAVLGRADLMDRWPPGAHGSTFGGNPVACAAGLATLRVMEREGLVQRAAELGSKALAFLRDVQRDHPEIGDVRGLGLMIGVELVEPDGSPAVGKVKEVIAKATGDGLLLTKCGESVIRICPPLVISWDQLEEGLGILVRAISSV
ncbi:MAG: aminotransferase class III-fold pyridoxal phosphate-dependent enzyme [Armatimonadota bacterium]|nr:aminotransferase class III-fold pyridoxal phosphate-dependent enzyme [Armatimonadota bacterium]